MRSDNGAVVTMTTPVLRKGLPPFAVVAILVVALAGIGAGAIGTYLYPPPETGRLETLWTLSWPGLPIVGAVILLRRPGNKVGGALLAIGTGIGLGLGCSALLEILAAPPVGVTAVLIAGDTLGFTMGFGLLPLLLLYYPDGRVPTRLRFLPPVVVTLIAATTVGQVLRPGQVATLRGDLVINPLGLTRLEPLLATTTTVGVLLLMACGVIAVALTVVRSRRAVGIERLQRRWFTLAVLIFISLFLTGVIVNEAVSSRAANPFIYSGFVLGINGIAVAIGVAVLRYRLYEIDRIISRTVTYGLITAVLISVYALVAVVPAALFDLQSDLLVAGATLVAAAAFGPVRRRIQDLVDRRFNRSGYDAAQVAEGFAERLRDQMDLGQVCADLQGVVARTVQPRHLSLWLQEERR